MEIVIACGGLAFGPDTLACLPLGGSETAVIEVARELRGRGHQVTVFCNLPPEGRADHVASGALSANGVRYVSLADYAEFITRTEADLLVASRDPALLDLRHHARKAVFWSHDLATYKHTRPALLRTSWNFDEVWCVSQFHRRQMHAVVGYPLEHIHVIRNGIARFDVAPAAERRERHLLYAARPERGLEDLVRPGGIMAELADYRLVVATYEIPGQAESPYYQRLWALCAERPNVERAGALTQAELRRLMSASSAYVYPTEFEEVSCILARECIEQRLPVVATAVGALPETLGDCAVWAPDTGAGFAAAVRHLHDDPKLYRDLQARMGRRTDLYWDEVAAEWERRAEPPPPRTFSLAWSLREDGDILAAAAVLARRAPDEGPAVDRLRRRIEHEFPGLRDAETAEAVLLPLLPLLPLFVSPADGGGDARPEGWPDAVLAKAPGFLLQAELEQLPPGSTVLVFGCGGGHEVVALAGAIPDLAFTAVDPRTAALATAEELRRERGLDNLYFASSLPDVGRGPFAGPFDALVCCGLLERLRRPWLALEELEARVARGGRVTVVVRSGAWEAHAQESENADGPRAWNPDPWMLRQMLSRKPGFVLRCQPLRATGEGRLLAHLVASYRADGAAIPPVDPLDKARRHRARQTCAAAVIAMDSEETILQMLGSIRADVQQVQIALAPSHDRTEALVREWAERHPGLDVRIKPVPRIEVRRYGFDDARNASLEGLEADWVLWIDTDEYLAGQGLSRYLRPNALDAYLIHQHHFSTDARGAPTPTDTPARLFRNDGRMRFFGKVHEQAEKGRNGLSGFSTTLPDVDIGHLGYRDEATRWRRFRRNLPLVYWDHEVDPGRLIGKYIWLRDLVLQMRSEAGQAGGDPRSPHHVEALRLAREAVGFYRAEWRAFEPAMGGGRVLLGLAFYSQAMALLGEGLPVDWSLGVADEEPIHVSGVFRDEDEALDVLREVLKPLFERRRSRYWE